MLPAAKHVKSMCEGPNGLFNTLKKGSTVIDCSTIGPIAAKELYESGRDAGINFVDAPVSGGVKRAADGTLTFMVGAESEKVFDYVNKTLQPMGQNIFNCE